MERTKFRDPRPLRLRLELASMTPEMRIAAEVALQLRISPKHTDDGTPEGTCERPLSVKRETPAEVSPTRKGALLDPHPVSR